MKEKPRGEKEPTICEEHEIQIGCSCDACIEKWDQLRQDYYGE